MNQVISDPSGDLLHGDDDGWFHPHEWGDGDGRGRDQDDKDLRRLARSRCKMRHKKGENLHRDVDSTD